MEVEGSERPIQVCSTTRHLAGLDLHISVFVFQSQLDSKGAAPDVTAQLTVALQQRGITPTVWPLKQQLGELQP